MEIKNLLTLKTRQELRAWLTEHSATKTEAWLTFSRKPAAGKISYLEIVEEVLCFGWIDGLHKTADDGSHVQRISPRKKKGNWTELNKERVRRLEKLGLMTEQGRQSLPDMSEQSFVIDPDIENALKAEPELYDVFMTFPSLYIRVRLDTIQFYKKSDPELYQKRLNKFIENTRQGKLYGDWHDNGLLLDY